MTTTTQRFIVKEVYKFGMLFGYRVFDTIENVNLPFDFDEDEKHRAETRCELSNAFADIKQQTKNKIMAQNLKPNRLDNRGGKREGSGRPKSIPTKILTIRVAAAIYDELKAIVKSKDAEYRKL